MGEKFDDCKPVSAGTLVKFANCAVLPVTRVLHVRKEIEEIFCHIVCSCVTATVSTASAASAISVVSTRVVFTNPSNSKINSKWRKLVL